MKRLFHLKFLRDVALSGTAQITQAACAMLAGILVSRSLGPSGKGTLSVLVTLGSVAMLLATFGLQNPSVYLLGRFKQDKDKIISNNTLVGVFGGFIAAAGLAAVVLTWRGLFLNDVRVEYFLLYLVAVPFIFYAQFAERITLGSRRFGLYSFSFFTEGFALLFGTFLLLHFFGDEMIPQIMLRVGIAITIAVGLAIMIVKSIGFRFEPSWRLLTLQARYGLRSYAAALQWRFLLQSDIVLCNYFLGAAKTGIYSVAVSFGLPVTLLASIIGSVLYQRVASAEVARVRIANTNRVIRILTPLASVTALCVGILSIWVVPALYGRAFSSAPLALALLLPGLVSLTLETALMNFFSGEGYPPVVVRAPMVGLIVNLAANLYVIPHWGINGASVTSSVAYTAVLIVVLHRYREHTGSSVSEVFFLRISDIRMLLHPAPVKTDSDSAA